MAPAFLRRAAYEDNAEDLPAGRMGMTWEIVVIVVLVLVVISIIGTLCFVRRRRRRRQDVLEDARDEMRYAEGVGAAPASWPADHRTNWNDRSLPPPASARTSTQTCVPPPLPYGLGRAAKHTSSASSKDSRSSSRSPHP